MSDSSETATRRELLMATGLVGAVGLAGCSSGDESGDGGDSNPTDSAGATTTGTEESGDAESTAGSDATRAETDAASSDGDGAGVTLAEGRSFDGPDYDVQGLAGTGDRLWVAEPYPKLVHEVDPATNWVVDTYSIGGQSVELQDLCWDGKLVWVVDTRKTLRGIDPASGSLARTIEVPDPGPTGIAWDGTSFYVRIGGELLTVDSSGAVANRISPEARIGRCIGWGDGLVWQAGDEIRGIDPTSGSVERSFAAPGYGSKSTAFVDGSLLVTDTLGRRYTVDPDSGDVGGETRYPTEISGATWAAGALWLLEFQTGTAYEVAPDSGTVRTRVDVPAEFPRGLAHDGQRFWTAERNTGTFVRFDAAGNGTDAFTNAEIGVTGAAYVDGALWTIGRDGPVREIDPASGSVRDSHEVGSASGQLCHDGQAFWLGSSNRRVAFVYERTPGGEFREVTTTDTTSGVALASDGDRLWRASESGSVTEFAIGR